MTSSVRSTQPFAEALGELLRQRQGDPLGVISMRAFFAQISGYGYDTLRKMVRGQLTLQPEAIKAMATVLGVPPEYFLEYRSWQIQDGLRRHPQATDDIYDVLMKSFARLDDPS